MSRGSMRVSMYYNNRDVRVQEMPVPEIGPGELLLKVMASGICGSDVMEWYRIKKAPLVLGHEVTGEVVEIGGDVTDFKPGDRVSVAHHIPCNTCRYCLNGDHTACETLHTTNFFPGGFAEYLRAPALNVDRGTFLLPDEVSYEDGSFIEPLGCVIRGHRVAGFRPGQSVLILGSGISGMLHLLLARALGAGPVICTDVSSYRLQMAKELGASAVFDAREADVEKVKDANYGRGVDLAIVCTSALSAFCQAIDSVDRGGTVLCFAPTDPGVELKFPANDFWRNGTRLVPTYGSAPYDSQVAIDLISSNRVAVDKLITHRLSLDEAKEGFRLVAEGQESMKVLFKPHGD